MAEREYLVLSDEFQRLLGAFHVLWAQVDLAVDVGLSIFLRITDEETHLLTAGAEFGRKISLLRSLAARSDHKQRGTIISSLNVYQNKSYRDVFAHSYVGDHDTEAKVVFMYRPRGRPSYSEHTYSLEEFAAHVTALNKAYQEFVRALQIPADRLQEFANAAESLNAKS